MHSYKIIIIIGDSTLEDGCRVSDAERDIHAVSNDVVYDLRFHRNIFCVVSSQVTMPLTSSCTSQHSIYYFTFVYQKQFRDQLNAAPAAGSVSLVSFVGVRASIHRNAEKTQNLLFSLWHQQQAPPAIDISGEAIECQRTDLFVITRNNTIFSSIRFVFGSVCSLCRNCSLLVSVNAFHFFASSCLALSCAHFVRRFECHYCHWLPSWPGSSQHWLPPPAARRHNGNWRTILNTK